MKLAMEVKEMFTDGFLGSIAALFVIGSITFFLFVTGMYIGAGMTWVCRALDRWFYNRTVAKHTARNATIDKQMKDSAPYYASIISERKALSLSGILMLSEWFHVTCEHGCGRLYEVPYGDVWRKFVSQVTTFGIRHQELTGHRVLFERHATRTTLAQNILYEASGQAGIDIQNTLAGIANRQSSKAEADPK